MRLKKLEIVGFKSFVDRTVLLFDRHVTAIVGPNGCGKSNVVDALRWAMGEQSAQRLRGKHMEDVIFAGSERRGPHGFAEVTLTFDNGDGLSPPKYQAYAEITVGRRLDRQGRSSYFINRTPVRLQDVTELFLGTGVGRRAYSVVEQGRIGFIVTSKPEDRRVLIEEAAGITRFKARRRAAERKMEQTRQNLLRVGDVLRELEKTLASLKRQAQKARRYRAYAEERRELELWVASHAWLRASVERAAVAERFERETARLEGIRAAVRFLEAELGADRTAFDRLSEQLEAAQREAYRLDNEARLLEASVREHRRRIAELAERERQAEQERGALQQQRERLLAERELVVGRLQRVEEELQEASDALQREQQALEAHRQAVQQAEQQAQAARQRLAELERRGVRTETMLGTFEQRRQEATGRLERLREERAELGGRLQQLDERIAGLGRDLQAQEAALQAQREQLASLERERTALRERAEAHEASLRKLRTEHERARSRLESLQRVHERFEGVGAGVRALMREYAPDEDKRAERGLLGLVADRLEADEDVQAALAAALGERLEAVVVRHEEAALGALRFLQERAARKGKGGRATLLPREPRGPAPRWEGALQGGAEPLLERIRFAAEDEPLARHLLGDVLLVQDVQQALALRAEGVRAVFVTRDGQRLGPDGSWSGGGGEEGAAHLLALQREMRRLRARSRQLAEALQQAEQERVELQAERQRLREALEAAREAAHRQEVGLVAMRRDAAQAERERAEAARRRERTEREIAELEASLRAADEQERSAREQLDELSREVEAGRAALQQAEAVLVERRGEMERQAQRLGEAQVRLATVRQRRGADQEAAGRLEQSLRQAEQRLERLAQELGAGAEEQGRRFGQMVQQADRLETTRAEALRAERQAEALRGRHAGFRERLGAGEHALRARRELLEAGERDNGELRLRLQQLDMERQHLVQRVEERHRVDLRHVLLEHHARPEAGPEVRERIAQLDRLIERMGPVNPAAVEEYAEQSERYEFLSAQKQDLEEALAGLEKAIRKMDRESRRLFREAFDAVAERFRHIFPQLFGGGRAELRLTDPDDLLSSGVDIVAQPPGKKLGSLELMSGGEKALTAVALIFALFQYRPSPFCVLDEVDAPLDEANIERFAQAVRQMTDRSQFILITHARRTMEYADVLYGVTMDEPGISKVVSVELRGERRPLPEPQGAPAVA